MKIEDIEQIAPNRPNIGLVFGLAGAALLVLLVLAIVFLDVEGGHLTFRHHAAHPTSQLILQPDFLQLDSRYCVSAA